MKTSKIAKKDLYGYKGVQYDLEEKEFFCHPVKQQKRKVYTLNKKAHQKGELVMCENGIHYCPSIKEVFDYYYADYNHFYYKIRVPKGTFYIKEGNKNATQTIEPIELLKNSCVLEQMGYIKDCEHKRRIYAKGFDKGCISIAGSDYYTYMFDTPEAYEKFIERKRKYERITIDYMLYKSMFTEVIVIK